MIVRELIDILEGFDEDMEVRIGMIQTYGSDFAKEIDDVEVRTINAWYEDNYDAVVITEGRQIGTVDYDE